MIKMRRILLASLIIFGIILIGGIAALAFGQPSGNQVITINDFQNKGSLTYNLTTHDLTIKTPSFNGYIEGNVKADLKVNSGKSQVLLFNNTSSFAFHQKDGVKRANGSITGTFQEANGHWSGEIIFESSKASFNLIMSKNAPEVVSTINQLKNAFLSNDYKSIYKLLSVNVTGTVSYNDFVAQSPKNLKITGISLTGKPEITTNSGIMVAKQTIKMVVEQNGKSQTITSSWVFDLENGEWKFSGSPD